MCRLKNFTDTSGSTFGHARTILEREPGGTRLLCGHPFSARVRARVIPIAIGTVRIAAGLGTIVSARACAEVIDFVHGVLAAEHVNFGSWSVCAVRIECRICLVQCPAGRTFGTFDNVACEALSGRA